MKKNKTNPNKLALARDTLRVLTADEVTLAHGGWTMSGMPWCQVRSVGGGGGGLTCGTGSVVGG